MEPTPFNLEHAIDKYITSVINQGSLTNADAIELTAHLYDATADLQQNNLTAEEAFMVAIKRLGTENVLTEEYSKVNPSIYTNKIWAYLFIGFNLLYTVPSLMLLGIIGVYYGIYFYFQDSNTAYILATLFHILFIAFVWLIVGRKNKISHFIEKQINANSLRITMISFLPLFIFFAVNPQFMKLRINDYLFYPMRKWNGTIVEFTYYMAVLSIIGAVLSLVFTINNKDKFSLKALFEKPSVIFLLCFGVFIELFAASSRSLNGIFPHFSAIPFALIYLMATFLVSYYNKLRGVKYILLFVASGFFLEASASVLAILRTDSYQGKVYYICALMIGVLVGRLLGFKYGTSKVVTES